MAAETDSAPEHPPAVQQPLLATDRLLLRPFDEADAPTVQELLSDGSIAANTRTFDHPYPEGAALKWVRGHPDRWSSGQAAIFAVCLRDARQDASGHPVAEPLLVGAIGLHIQTADHSAELGYWIGKPWWNRGIASEAARRIVAWGFDALGLNRIFAHHMISNPSSGAVLRKAGLTLEGTLRQHVRKYGVFHDIAVYGILANEREPNGPE
jgi:[ribosomal protein S5]-alanine N-acetyltransferase